MESELEAIEPLSFKPGMRAGTLFRISDKRMREGDVRAAAEAEKLKNQEELIMKIIAEQKLILKPEHIYRETRSAFRYPEEKRPVVQEIMKAAAAREFDVFIVFKTDRVTRRGGVALLSYIDRFNKGGCNLYSCCNYWADIRDTMGETMWFFIGQMERAESEGMSKRMKRSRARRGAEGRFLGGSKEIRLNEEEAMEARRLHALGWGYDAIVEYMQEKNPEVTVWAIRKLISKT